MWRIVLSCWQLLGIAGDRWESVRTFWELLGLLGSAGNRWNLLDSVGDSWKLLLLELVGDCWGVLGILGKYWALFGNSCEVLQVLWN